MVLWILACLSTFRVRDFYPLWSQLSSCSFCYVLRIIMPVLNPTGYCYPMVWANPLSLATTYGISFDLFSCWYLDVSVPNVCPRYTMNSCNDDQMFSLAGFPHSDICGSMAICASPQLFAACHVLHRLLVPRHSPYALSSLTSFSNFLRFHQFS